MKFVYVLISSDKDFYAEEALVSMYSLKKHNPDGEIILVSDENTLESLKGNRGRVHDYVDNYITVNPPANLTQVQKSRFLKTSIRRLIEGDFLYMDNDTVVYGSLNDIFISTGDICAVLDKHLTDDNQIISNKRIREYCECLGLGNLLTLTVGDYFNGGILYARDSEPAHDFFKKWHDLWLEGSRKGFNYDQPALWYTNYQMNGIITPLEGVYNCQIRCKHSLQYLEDCRILHYFSDLKHYQGFFMQDKKNLQYIRDNGLDRKITDLIDNIKCDYGTQDMIILKDNELEIYNSPLVILARKLSRDFPYTNKLAKACYRLFGYKI